MAVAVKGSRVQRSASRRPPELSSLQRSGQCSTVSRSQAGYDENDRCLRQPNPTSSSSSTRDDTPIGAVSKAQLGQREGVRFRIAHGFLFDVEGQLLLQQLRANA